MNKIEEQIKKFETIKQKIPQTLIPSLINEKPSISNSLLFYFIKKKHNSSHKNATKNVFVSNPNITDNPQEPKQKEKNKFITQKAEERGKSKTQQGKSHGNNNEQEKNNKGNNSKDTDSSVRRLNLLQIENNNMPRGELKKMFEKDREEEEKLKNDKKINQEREAGKEEKQPENEKEKEKEEKPEMQIEEEEKEKKEEPEEKEEELIIYNPNYNNTNNMNLNRAESGINLPDNFNIFDDYKLKEEEYDNENNFYYEERNKETFSKHDIFEENNIISVENKEEIQVEIQDKKEQEKEEEEKIPLIENENNSNCLKICIPLEEEGEKEKKDKMIVKPLPENEIKKLNSDKKNIPEKLLQNKIKRNTTNEIKKNNTSTNINTITNKTEKNIIPSKSKKKVITDDDEEEFILKEKIDTKKIYNKKKEGEPIIKTKGSKIQLLLEPDELKNTKENDLNNDNNKSNKKANEKNEIKINIEKESENKIKKNNNLINKNKNGSQINSTKNSNIYNTYDLLCLNNIHDILISIEEKLSKENKDKTAIKKCFDLIDDVKKTDVNNLIRRKKNTYKCVFDILRILFNDLGKKKIAKNYNNEIVAILTNVENYYKLVKQNDNEINNIEYFYNRKIAFKYVFSKLELRNCEKENLKGLYIINKDNNGESNKTITDSNKAIKFIKTFKRYIKTSSKINQELKNFKKKLEVNEKTNFIKGLLDKYEYCGADLQMSSHLMGYNRLFSHFGLIFSFCNDSNNKKLLGEIEEQKKKEINHTNHINDIKKKGKSVQVSKNGFKEKREASVNNIKMKSNNNK